MPPADVADPQLDPTDAEDAEVVELAGRWVFETWFSTERAEGVIPASERRPENDHARGVAAAGVV